MDVSEIIAQLESLRANSKDFARSTGADPIWQKDIVAIDAAIELIKKDMPPQMSEIIAQFLALVHENGGRYAGSLERIKLQDARTQDILHDIELNEHTDAGLLALTQELAAVRRERRIDKDAFEIAEKIKMCMARQEIAIAVKAFERMLGDVRKVESYHEKRVYRRRVDI